MNYNDNACMILFDHRLLLLDQELDNFLLEVLVLRRGVLRVLAVPESQPALLLLRRLGLPLLPVAHELVVLVLSFLFQLLRRLRHPHGVLGVELLAVLLDLLHLLPRQQGLGARAPLEVAELVDLHSLEDLALERPHPVGVVNLVTPPAHAGHKVPPRWVPIDVRAHEVLAAVHGGEVRRVDEFQHPVHVLEAGEHAELPVGAPEEVIGRFPLVLLQQVWSLALLHAVEADAKRLALAVNDGKLGADGFPREGVHVLLDLDAVHGNLLHAHVEDLKVVVEAGVLGALVLLLAQLVVAVDLDAEEVSALLPVHSAIGDVEEVLDAHLVAGGHFDQGDTSRYIFVFGHPVTEDVLRWRPCKISHAGHLDTLLIHQTKRRSLVDTECRLGRHAGKVLVVVRPLEDGPDRGPVGVERPLLQTRPALPHDNCGWLLGTRACIRRKGHNVAFARREVNELDAGVREPLQLVEVLSAPQDTALGVEGDEVGAERGPLHVGFGPPRAALHFRCLGFGVAVDSDLLAALEHNAELVVRVGLEEPALEVTLVFVLLFLRRFPLVRDVQILVKIGEEAYGESVLFVQLVLVERLDGLYSTTVVRVLEEDVSLGLVVVVQGVVFVDDVAQFRKDLADDALQLFNALGTHHGDAVDDDHTVYTVRLLWTLLHQVRHEISIADIVNKVLVVREIGHLIIVAVLGFVDVFFVVFGLCRVLHLFRHFASSHGFPYSHKVCRDDKRITIVDL